jgi:hypothetical protein
VTLTQLNGVACPDCTYHNLGDAAHCEICARVSAAIRERQADYGIAFYDKRDVIPCIAINQVYNQIIRQRALRVQDVYNDDLR